MGSLAYSARVLFIRMTLESVDDFGTDIERQSLGLFKDKTAGLDFPDLIFHDLHLRLIDANFISIETA
jgi:hypothetical protein